MEKIIRYSSIVEDHFTEGENDIPDYFSGDVGDDGDHQSQIDSEMKDLCYWIEQLFESNTIDVSVQSKNLDISIYIFLGDKEKISKMIRIFEVADKIKNDLSDYKSESDLYENKDGFSILLIKFEVINGNIFDADEEGFPF